MDLELALIVLVTVLSVAATALAFLCFWQTRRKLRSEDGRVICFEDSFHERLEKLEDLLKKSNALRKQTLEAGGTRSKESLSMLGKIQSELDRALAANHRDIGDLLTGAQREIAETRSILSDIRHLAEEKKEELEDYKVGFRASASKEALVHLCDVRDHLILTLAKLRASPTVDVASVCELETVEWELADTLERLDLIEIEANPGDSWKEDRLAGRVKLLGTLPASNPADHGRIARVLKRGYILRVKRHSGDEEIVFRQVQAQGFRDDSAGAEDRAGTAPREESGGPADNDKPPVKLEPQEK